MDFILVLSFKDQVDFILISHDNFLASWNMLSEVDFFCQTFPKKSHIATILASQITNLIIHPSMKTPFASVVNPAKPSLFRRSFLTGAQNTFLQGSLKPVP